MMKNVVRVLFSILIVVLAIVWIVLNIATYGVLGGLWRIGFVLVVSITIPALIHWLYD